MAPIKKKTRKRLGKQMRKLVKKHGQEAVTGLVTTAVSAATAKLAIDSNDQPKKRKNAKKDKSVTAGRASV
jgi:hypothetical protein